MATSEIPMWKEIAHGMFPELAERIAEAETPYLLWFELRDAFEKAYDPPRNESVIKRVYEYANWCDTQPRGKTADDDLLTVVAVCFYEHLPTHPLTRADMPRWFTLEELMNMERLLRYHISAEDFLDLRHLLVLANADALVNQIGEEIERFNSDMNFLKLFRRISCAFNPVPPQIIFY